MYARGDVILLIVRPEEQPYWFDYTTPLVSRLVVLDVRDPSDIVLLDELELEGTTEDSRVVGDVLYLVNRIVDGCTVCDDDGVCTWCNEGSRTVVSSVGIADPRARLASTSSRSWTTSTTATMPTPSS